MPGKIRRKLFLKLSLIQVLTLSFWTPPAFELLATYINAKASGRYWITISSISSPTPGLSTITIPFYNSVTKVIWEWYQVKTYHFPDTRVWRHPSSRPVNFKILSWARGKTQIGLSGAKAPVDKKSQSISPHSKPLKIWLLCKSAS